MVVEVAGIDAYRRGKEAGWVAVRLRGGRFAGALRGASLRQDVLPALADAATIAIDMPIGLPSEGSRRCDREARAFAGPRRQSVFPTPPRAALVAGTHAEASALCRRLTGAGLPQQAYGLRAKILELEPIAEADRRIVEVHPELSFTEMAGGPVNHPKGTWSGQTLRLRLLAAAGIELPDELGEAGSVPSVDLLDAAAAAWSAWRVQAGQAIPLPAAAAAGEPVIWR